MNLAKHILPSQRLKISVLKKYKKMEVPSNLEKKTVFNSEDEDETISETFSDTADDTEFRIDSWLCTRGIELADPRDKEEGFFREKKNDCNSFVRLSGGSEQKISVISQMRGTLRKGESFSLTNSMKESSLLNRRKKMKRGLTIATTATKTTNSSKGSTLVIRPLTLNCSSQLKNRSSVNSKIFA
jgi:hypothetical protein